MRGDLARRSAAVALVFAIVLAPGASAWGWANGARGSDFGTHDWVLHEADRLAAAAGHGWVDERVALPATADPDKVFRDFRHHVDTIGGDGYGDAPDRVSILYAQAVAQLRAGDRPGASRTIGWIAHYYADVCNPLHTGQTASEDKVHGPYETAVDKLTSSPGMNEDWVRAKAIEPVGDPSAFTHAAAVVAHRDYDTIVRGYPKEKLHGAVLAATEAALDRAANGLADIVVSVELAAASKKTTPRPRSSSETASVEPTGAGDLAADATPAIEPTAEPAGDGETSRAPASSTGSGTPAAGLACAGALVVLAGAGVVLLARRRSR